MKASISFEREETTPSEVQWFKKIFTGMFKNRVLLEANAGKGKMTSVLGSLAKSVIAFEMDPSRARTIASNFGDNVNVVVGDALEFLRIIKYDVAVLDPSWNSDWTSESTEVRSRGYYLGAKSRNAFLMAPSGTGKTRMAGRHRWLVDLDPLISKNIGFPPGKFWENKAVLDAFNERAANYVSSLLLGRDGITFMYSDNFGGRIQADYRVVIPEERHLRNLLHHRPGHPGVEDWKSILNNRREIKESGDSPLYDNWLEAVSDTRHRFVSSQLFSRNESVITTARRVLNAGGKVVIKLPLAYSLERLDQLGPYQYVTHSDGLLMVAVGFGKLSAWEVRDTGKTRIGFANRATVSRQARRELVHWPYLNTVATIKNDVWDGWIEQPKVLDVGSGSGPDVGRYAFIRADVTFIEPAADQVEKLKVRLEEEKFEANVYVSDFFSFKTSEKYDYVVFSFSAGQVSRWAKLIWNRARLMLKKGGKLVMLTVSDRALDDVLNGEPSVSSDYFSIMMTDPKMRKFKMNIGGLLEFEDSALILDGVDGALVEKPFLGENAQPRNGVEDLLMLYSLIEISEWVGESDL